MDKLGFIPTRLQAMRGELYALGEPTPELFTYIRANRINHATALAHSGLMAVALVTAFESAVGENTFKFSPGGVPAVVVEVLGADGQTIIDLAAWPINAPYAVATAVGETDLVGVWHMVARGGAPLEVHRTPHDWLCRGCEGCAPLNLNWFGHWLDKAGGPFVVRDVDDGRWLRDLLGSKGSHHRILVSELRERNAA